METIDIDGVSISSSGETEEAMRAAFDEAPETADASDASADGNAEAPPQSEAVSTDPKPTPAAKVDKRTKEGRKASIQAEISETYAAKKAVERETAELAQQLQEMRAQVAALSAPKPEIAQPAVSQPVHQAPADDPEPVAENYPPEQFGKFIADQARWHARQEFRAQQQTVQDSQRRQAIDNQRRNAHRQFAERMGAAFQADPTLKDRIVTLPFANVKPLLFLEKDEPGNYLNAIGQVILDSDMPAKLIGHFEQHPEDLQRLSTLHPAEFSRQIGRIEARLEAALPSGPAAKPLAISLAKPIPKPVVGDAHIDDDSSDDADDLSEAAVMRHIRRENSQDPRFGRAARR